MELITPIDKFTQLAIKNGMDIYGNPPTGQKTSYADYDDGYYQKGKKYSGTRFTDLGDGSVLDNCTGLIWLKEPSAWQPFYTTPGTAKTMQWETALTTCKNFTAQGKSDWTVPTIDEIQSVINYGNANPAIGEVTRGNGGSQLPFIGLVNSQYWSSTSDLNNLSNAWVVYMDTGLLISYGKISYRHVLPVRRITTETT